MSTYTKVTDMQQSRERLSELLKPGDAVYTNINHVSASGMTRWISTYIARDSEIIDITWNVAKLIDESVNKGHAGIKLQGCGMDMAFYLVYELGRALWPDGFPCIGEGCPANDHVNQWNGPRGAGVVHRDSGYALNKRSL